MQVSKYFATLRKAEQHQVRLYGMYDVVRLIKSPRFTEAGIYVWEVQKSFGSRATVEKRTRAITHSDTKNA